MRAALTACALLAAGCATYYDPCFAPQGLVRDLRVLGLRADPPEASADLGSGVVAKVTVTVLLGDLSDYAAPASLTASLCAPTEDHVCPEGSLVVARLAGYPTASFDVVAPAELLRAALAVDPLRGYGGIRLQLDLFVSRDPGPVQTRASKLLLYSQPDPTQVPNHAIEVPGLRVLREGAAPEDLQPGATLSVDVAQTVGLRPLIAPGAGATEAAELYTVTDLSGRVVTLREHVTYSFFVTPHNMFGTLVNGAGNFNVEGSAAPDVGDEPAPGTPDPPRGLAQLTALSQSVGRLWVVARDGRGGEAWISVVLRSNETRPGPPYPFLEHECL
jgi:hypothetical protein